MSTLSFTQGTLYYVQVSAKNSHGWGDSTPTEPSSLNPHEAPQRPTNVTLATTSDTTIAVSFNPPANDGGDKVASYRVEWDTEESFKGILSQPHKGYTDLDAKEYQSWTIQVRKSSTFPIIILPTNPLTQLITHTITDPTTHFTNKTTPPTHLTHSPTHPTRPLTHPPK